MTSLKKWLLLGFLCCACAAYADSLEELFTKALENDNQLEILTLSETNTRLGIEKRDLPKRIGIVAATDDVGIGVTQVFTDPSSTFFALDPYVTLTLGENVETVSLT